MKFWPENQERIQKIAVILGLLFSGLAILFGIVFIRYKKSAQIPSCLTLSSFPLDIASSVCPQRVNPENLFLADGRIQARPNCLAIMNSRFGSRFNFDWLFSENKINSGILGTFEDKETGFDLSLRNEKETVRLFPILPNSRFAVTSVDLGLTYQQTDFVSQDALVSLKIISPFSPTESFQDEANKMNVAPFFYLQISLTNKTAQKQSAGLKTSFSQATEAGLSGGLKAVYFRDGVRKEGRRALVVLSNQDQIKPFIANKRGGFEWLIELEPGETDTLRLVYAGFLDGKVLTQDDPVHRLFTFAYHRWFGDLDEVIRFAVVEEEEILAKTINFENKVGRQIISPRRKWLLAQAFHSYLGNTWLVCEEADCPDFDWFVWEGHFKYLNTLDVAHDYAVLEGLFFPWVLKSELNSWQQAAKKDDWGVVIPHDLGSRFRLKNTQAYGIPGWETSGMPVEENSNFILLTFWYWRQSQDQDFIKELLPFLNELIVSLAKRDTNNNGIADEGIGITTYDNDGNAALKQGPDSSYLGIKQLAAYTSALEIFKTFNREDFYQTASEQAELISRSLEAAFEKYGLIPLSLDSEFKEKIAFENKTISGIEEQGFAIITGLFYPALTGLKHPALDNVVSLLRQAYPQAYQKSLAKDENGTLIGLKLTQYQDLGLGWVSHSLMADFISQKLFDFSGQAEDIFFPLLLDNPQAWADGYYFKEPLYPPQITLGFYPRGAVLFADLY
ncbi:MAG: DUF4965 domain-containing protein [Candidatus Pacebacteria bacterium]|nr:DUF4965 domain-containing protein [Candidatus Paceibacterota bacterium]